VYSSFLERRVRRTLCRAVYYQRFGHEGKSTRPPLVKAEIGGIYLIGVRPETGQNAAVFVKLSQLLSAG
jgi:hypothetical protein